MHRQSTKQIPCRRLLQNMIYRTVSWILSLIYLFLNSSCVLIRRINILKSKQKSTLDRIDLFFDSIEHEMSFIWGSRITKLLQIYSYKL